MIRWLVDILDGFLGTIILAWWLGILVGLGVLAGLALYWGTILIFRATV